MLDFIRKHRTFFSVFFVLIAISMVVSLFATPGMHGGGGSLSSGVAAKVEGQEIPARELAESLSRQIQEAERMLDEQSKGNPQSRQFLEMYVRSQISPERVLQRLIQQKFLMTTADSLGVAAAPDSIREIIQKDPSFQKDGAFDPLMYRQRVLETARFEDELAMQIKFMNLSRTFESGLAVLSPSEKAENDRLAAKHIFETVSVNPRTFPEPKAVAPDAVKAFLASPTAGAKLQAYYDRNRSRFETRDQVHARHILVDEKSGGEAKIKEIAAEIRGGKISFEEAAKKYSIDKSNASKGGDLGFFTKEVMDPAFSTAAFALKNPKEISAPVKSSFGFHLIELVEKKSASKKTLAEVKDEIAPAVALEEQKVAKATAWLAQWSGGKAPSDAELKKLNLSWTKQPEWNALDERLGSVGSIDAVLPELLTLNAQKKILSKPLSQGESLVIVRWVSTQLPDAKAAPVAAKGKEKSPPEEPRSPYAFEQEKAQQALQFYLQQRFEGLEKDKKIVRSQKILSELGQQLNASRGG